MKRIFSITLSVLISMITCFSVFVNADNNTIDLFTQLDPYSDSVQDDNYNESSTNTVPRKKAHVSDNSVIPIKYDSRDLGIVPLVRSQEGTGACWAFATLASMEIDAVIKGYTTVDKVDFSESHLVAFTYSGATDNTDPTYGEYYFSDDPYLIGGNWIRSCGTLSKWSGPAEESKFKFDSNNVNNMLNYPEADRYDTSAGVVLDNTEVLSNSSDIKSWIIEHGSCTVSIFYDEQYENKSTSSYYCDIGGQGINHMVCIVGWDDNYSSSNFLISPPSDGAWLIRDSWGEEAHDNGYFWISYKDATVQSFAGFSCIKSDTYDYNYSYNGVGQTTTVNLASNSSLANVFISNSNEILKAVSISTASSDIIAQIKVYTDVTANNPISGALVSSQTETISNRGCHTISLNNPVVLTKGTKFSIVVTYSTSDNNAVIIPAERKNGFILSSTVSYLQDNSVYTIEHGLCYSCKVGQSYCNIPGKTNGWTDSSTKEMGNFYIQAFTVCGHKSTHVEKSNGQCGQLIECRVICDECGKTTISYNEQSVTHTMTGWEYIGNGKFENKCKNCEYSIVSDSDLKIKNNINGINENVKYKQGICLTAQCEVIPEGYTVAWYKNDSTVPVTTGYSYTETDLRETIDISVKLLDNYGNVVCNNNGSEIKDNETITIKTSFWIKLAALFKYLFKKPEIINQ